MICQGVSCQLVIMFSLDTVTLAGWFGCEFAKSKVMGFVSVHWRVLSDHVACFASIFFVALCFSSRVVISMFLRGFPCEWAKGNEPTSQCLESCLFWNATDSAAFEVFPFASLSMSFSWLSACGAQW